MSQASLPGHLEESTADEGPSTDSLRDQERLFRALMEEHERRIISALSQELKGLLPLLRNEEPCEKFRSAARGDAALSFSPFAELGRRSSWTMPTPPALPEPQKPPTPLAPQLQVRPRQRSGRRTEEPQTWAKAQGQQPDQISSRSRSTGDTVAVVKTGAEPEESRRGRGSKRFRTPHLRLNGTSWGGGDLKEHMTFSQREEALESAQAVYGESLSRIAWDDNVMTGSGTQTHCRSKIRAVMLSKYCEIVVLVMIALNIGFIGWQSDWEVKHPHDRNPLHFRLWDMAFTILFTVELILRLFADGKSSVSSSNPAGPWNLFDCCLILVSWVDEVVKATADAFEGISALRMVRLFRFARVLRAVRVARFFRDLRIMVWGIGHSMKSLIWALVLLFIVSFVFGIMILEFVGNELAGQVDSGLADTLVRTWGSLPQTVFVLYMAICGGIDWGQALEPLRDISPVMTVLFCFYIALAIFCVLNIITGVFVENTKAMVNKDETSLVMETIESRRRWLEEVRSLWESFGSPDELDIDTFSKHIKDVRVQALFRRLGVEVEDESVQALFELLDLTGSGGVSVDEFALAIQMLHGQARSIDMARLRVGMSYLLVQLRELRSIIDPARRSVSSCSDLTFDSLPESVAAQRRTRFALPVEVRGVQNDSGQVVPPQLPLIGPQGFVDAFPLDEVDESIMNALDEGNDFAMWTADEEV